MLQALNSITGVLALIAIIALLMIKIHEKNKRIKTLCRYLRDADDQVELQEVAARYLYNLLFAKLARHYPSGLKRSQGGLQCLIDLPTGQISTWCAPDKRDPRLSEEELATLDFTVEADIARLYTGLPEYRGTHDGHGLEQVITRLGGRYDDNSPETALPEIQLRG